MAIEASELKIYQPETINDTTTNGGYMSANEIVSGSSTNLFPNISQAERTAGSDKYRKLFFKIADSENNTLFNSKTYISLQTPAQDYVTFFPGSQSNTAAGITGSEDEYGCGSLNATISAGAVALDVFVEDSSLVIFRTGEVFKIYDGSNEEFVTISSVTPSGNVITLTFTALTYGYSSTNTLVASVYEDAEIKGSFSGFTVTSGNTGTYDDTTYPVALTNIGTVQDTFTITFATATTFTCAGARVGAVGSGNTTSDLQPLNSDFAEFYFILDWHGFGGTFQVNDTIEFTTVPAALPIWTRRIVPAGATSYSGNNFKMIIEGESS